MDSLTIKFRAVDPEDQPEPDALIMMLGKTTARHKEFLIAGYYDAATKMFCDVEGHPLTLRNWVPTHWGYLP